MDVTELDNLRITLDLMLLGISVLIGVVIHGIVYLSDILIPVLSVIGIIVLLHNAVAFATGAAAGLILSGMTATRRALTFEIGIQNSGLALIIILGQLQGLGGAAAVAAFWGVWHLIAGGVIVGLFRT
jgi:BASS family bile acid:Na+ symporter